MNHAHQANKEYLGVTVSITVVALLHSLFLWAGYWLEYVYLPLVWVSVIVGVSFCTHILMIMRASKPVTVNDDTQSFVLGHLLLITSVIIASCFYAPDARLACASFLFPLFLAGIGYLQIYAVTLISLLAWVGFTTCLLIHSEQSDADAVTARAILEGGVFTVLLSIFTCFGVYLGLTHRLLNNKSKELHDALQLISHLTIRDELTGLYNYKYAREVLRTQKELADRGEYHFVLCMVDVDQFEMIQQEHGRVAAESVLKTVARILESHVRNIDYCIRFSEHDFMLILVKTLAENARVVVERIKQNVEEKFFLEAAIDSRVSVSIGMTEYTCTESTEQTLSRAQMALQKAKDSTESIQILKSTSRSVELVRDAKNKFKPLHF